MSYLFSSYEKFVTSGCCRHFVAGTAFSRLRRYKPAPKPSVMNYKPAKENTMKHLLIIGALLMSGCAQMFPARYHEISPGVYLLESSGNVFVSAETLKNKIEKRAAELCGKDSYTYKEDDNFNVAESKSYTNGQEISAPYIVLTKTVQCNEQS